VLPEIVAGPETLKMIGKPELADADNAIVFVVYVIGVAGAVKLIVCGKTPAIMADPAPVRDGVKVIVKVGAVSTRGFAPSHPFAGHP
jgi:hypothetical protein